MVLSSLMKQRRPSGRRNFFCPVNTKMALLTLAGCICLNHSGFSIQGYVETTVTQSSDSYFRSSASSPLFWNSPLPPTSSVHDPHAVYLSRDPALAPCHVGADTRPWVPQTSFNLGIHTLILLFLRSLPSPGLPRVRILQFQSQNVF